MRPLTVCLLLFTAAMRLFAAEQDQDKEQDQSLVVRAAFVPQEAWVGQRVVLQVDVLAAGAWAQLDRIPSIELPGSYVLPPQGQGVRLQETIDGSAHSGQRYEYFVYPQTAGDLTLPPTAVGVRVREPGAVGAERTLSAVLPELSFESRVPPGAEAVEGLISTTDASVDQRWEPADGVHAVGDAVRRIVRFEAADVSGMAFTPLDHAPIDGFGVYPSEPRVDDRFDRGTLQGTRTETMTYVAERSGDFTLPTITFTWWNTQQERLQQVELPGLAVSVSGGNGGDSSAGPVAASRSPSWWWLLAVAMLVPLSLLAGRAWRALLAARAASERHRFRLLQAAVRRGRPADVMRELMRWLDRIEGGSRPARLDRFLERYGDPASRAALEALQKDLDGARPIGDRRELSHGLERLRKRWLDVSAEAGREGAVLPPLNG